MAKKNAKSTEMRQINKNVLGGTNKRATLDGPHLKQGQGTSFEQAKLTKGFLLQNPRPGHSQKANIQQPEKKA